MRCSYRGVKLLESRCSSEVAEVQRFWRFTGTQVHMCKGAEMQRSCRASAKLQRCECRC